MSSASGIAAVTAVLKDLLNNGLIAQDAAAVLGDVTVTALTPDRITQTTTSQLNLFLYLVMPNLGWRNVGLPSRAADGTLISGPPLALDLFYLLSSYGAKDLHAEILLGYAMKLLHETPVLSSDAIRGALSPSYAVNGAPGIPPELQDLFSSGLADQIEQIKITPNYLNSEDMFKLWMGIQSPYRLTMSYQVSVVLIDSDDAGSEAPPVVVSNVYANPLSQPIVNQILSQAPGPPVQPFIAGQPILSGYSLSLLGANLSGQSTTVAIDGVDLPLAGMLVSSSRVVVPLPAGTTAGTHGIQVVIRQNIGTPPAPHRSSQSLPVAFVLQPQISPPIAVTITSGEGGSNSTQREGSFEVTVVPEIGVSQQVSLLLNEYQPPASRAPRAYSLTAPSLDPDIDPATSPTVTVPFTTVLPATYFVRISVDGAESPLAMDANGSYATPQVVIS